jgi:hypothetical protein
MVPIWETTVSICPKRKMCHAKNKNYIATQGRMLTTENKLSEEKWPTFHGFQNKNKTKPEKRRH